MVDQAIAAEQNGLKGQACLDRKYGPIANLFDTGGGDCVAPSGGISVSLASSNPSVATAPSTVTILAGATNATFSIQTVPVSITTSAAIPATMGQITKTSTLTVTPHP